MRFARGDYVVEARMLLQAALIEPSRRERGRWLALNDVVIHKGGFARVVSLRVAVDDELIASYSADGVVISIPPGRCPRNHDWCDARHERAVGIKRGPA